MIHNNKRLETYTFDYLFKRGEIRMHTLSAKKEELGSIQLYKESLKILLTQTKAGIFEYDLLQHHIYPISGLYEERLDNLERENVPESWIKSGFVHFDSKEIILKLFEHLSENESFNTATIRVKEIKGGYKWIKLSAVLITEQNVKSKRAIFIIEDAPMQIDLEKRYFQEEQMRAMLTEDVIAASKVNLTENKVEYLWGTKINPEILKKVQTYEQMYEIGLKNIVEEEDKIRYFKLFSLPQLFYTFDEGKTSVLMEYQYKTPDGAILWALMSANLVRDSITNDLMYYSFIRDIDTKKRTELMLQERAERDGITGLYNKQTTQSMIQEIISNNREKVGISALIIMDLDNFKNINDCFGHPYGDYVLSEIGHILTNTFGIRTIAGRMGGDEFVIFIETISSKQWVCRKAEELCKTVYHYNFMENHDYILTCCVGIVFSSKKEAEFQTLYEQADEALYCAKRNGKNRYVVFKEQIVQQQIKTKISSAQISKNENFAEKTYLLDELEDLIFLIEPETYELVYMNRIACEKTKTFQYSGKKCYEVLQGIDRPCLFCKQHLSNMKSFQIWKNINTKLDSEFIIKDKIIYWDDKKLRLEIFINIEEIHSKAHSTSVVDVLLDSICRLLSTQDLKASLFYILKNIGIFYKAASVYFIELNQREREGEIKLKWRKEKSDNPDIISNIDKRQLFQWAETVSKEQIIILEDSNKISDFLRFKENNQTEGEIKLIYCAPYSIREEFGFIIVENPAQSLNEFTFLESIAYLSGLEISRYYVQKNQNYISEHDFLTGVLNRASYIKFIDSISFDAISSIGMASIDINGFKEYNQKYGYIHGDELLKTTANHLCRIFGTNSVYRFAADEFIILNLDITQETFCHRISKAKEQLKKIVTNGVSIGHIWTSTDFDIAQIEQHVDELMMIDKRMYYQNKKIEQKYFSSNILNGLEKAITEHKFVMYLQPKADIMTGQVCGAEALVRYYDTEHGLVPPIKFIPMMEKENLVYHIDFFIFEEVCRVLKEWEEKGYCLFPISLNFSRTTLLQKNLLETINEISDRYHIKRNLLEIEITESFGQVEIETLKEIGKQIEVGGYRLSLDDFGTQYSNLSIFSTLKLDVLKLDKSIINDIYTNSSVRIILEHLIMICKKIGIECVAEGIETEEQLQILKELKCDYGQGYLYNKPIEIKDFENKYFNKDFEKKYLKEKRHSEEK